jgi:hypothetical protein
LKTIETSFSANREGGASPTRPLQSGVTAFPNPTSRMTPGFDPSVRGCRLPRAFPVLILPFLLSVTTPPLTAGELTIAGRGVLTTNSLLYPNTNAPSDFDRGQSIELSSSFGAGIEIRYTMPDRHVAIGFSVDEVSTTASTTLSAGAAVAIPVEDGIRAVPVELTGYFIIPFSGEKITVYMGGGAGLYFGRRAYRIGSAESESASVPPGFGIHVLTGMSYRLIDHVEVMFDMKFRDLQFEAENRFTSRTTNIDGYLYSLPTGPIRSRSQTDGIILQLGVGVTL